jgi:hypothetical protein
MNKGTIFVALLLLISCPLAAQNLQKVTDSGYVTTNPIHIRNASGLMIAIDSSAGFPITAHAIKASPADNRTIRFDCSSNVATGGWEFYNNSTSRSLMYVKQGGNVGIGTTNPQAKLAVNGDVAARLFKTTVTGWPDFVFAKDYSLPSLQKVEAYIQSHHHLPEIPSAKEVEANGLDLGANQAKLLQKIEELTLYLIEQDKRLRAQATIIEQQEQRLKKLEKI